MRRKSGHNRLAVPVFTNPPGASLLIRETKGQTVKRYNHARKTALLLGLLAMTAISAHAELPDASAITATATTAFEAVGALVASAVAFFAVVKIVKWIRK